MAVGPREPRRSAGTRVPAREANPLAPGWGLRPLCPCCLGLFAHVALCPALRLAVASAQGAAGLSSVPVAPPGEAIISAFLRPRAAAPAGENTKRCVFKKHYDFKFVSILK